VETQQCDKRQINAGRTAASFGKRAGSPKLASLGTAYVAGVGTMLGSFSKAT
jgi:hypothetical protein